MSGKSAIDLSGALGVDTMFLARTFQEVVYCERDSRLCAVVLHNLKVSGIANVRVMNGKNISQLAEYPDNSFDLDLR
jgi:predicted O-methyltransferase YrrM